MEKTIFRISGSDLYIKFRVLKEMVKREKIELVWGRHLLFPWKMKTANETNNLMNTYVQDGRKMGVIGAI